MWKTNMEIMKNRLYDHCGPLLSLWISTFRSMWHYCFYNYIVTVFSIFSFLLQSSGLELLFNLSAKQTSWVEYLPSPLIFFFMKIKTQRYVNFIFLEHLKLETKSIFTLNIFSNILHTIGMEIGYILWSYTLNFLFIGSEVHVLIYVNNIERPFFVSSEAVGFVLRDSALNYVFTTCCMIINLTALSSCLC